MTAKRKKQTRRGAAKAPNWVRTVAASKSGTPKQRARHETRKLFSGSRKPAPIRTFTTEQRREIEQTIRAAQREGRL